MESQIAKNSFRLRLSGLPSLRQLLLIHIQEAIQLTRDPLVCSSETVRSEFMQVSIPLHRVQDDTQVVYKSAIALKLASLCKLPAFEIATYLKTALVTSSENSESQSESEFTLEISSQGWLFFRLTDQGLAAWLQYLIQHPLSLETFPLKAVNALNEQQPIIKPAHLFLIQYAHARCCSLLRLAHQQGLIELRSQPQSQIGQLIKPHPLPWCNFQSGGLCLNHPAEQRLISQLLTLLEDISTFQLPAQDREQNLHLVRLASNFSNAFLTFYRQCRIWGEVKAETPQLAQARLGLVSLTQSILQMMLEEGLGVAAPVEL
jgi:hypothetical protein